MRPASSIVFAFYVHNANRALTPAPLSCVGIKTQISASRAGTPSSVPRKQNFSNEATPAGSSPPSCHVSQAERTTYASQSASAGCPAVPEPARAHRCRGTSASNYAGRTALVWPYRFPEAAYAPSERRYPVDGCGPLVGQIRRIAATAAGSVPPLRCVTALPGGPERSKNTSADISWSASTRRSRPATGRRPETPPRSTALYPKGVSPVFEKSASVYFVGGQIRRTATTAAGQSRLLCHVTAVVQMSGERQRRRMPTRKTENDRERSIGPTENRCIGTAGSEYVALDSTWKGQLYERIVDKDRDTWNKIKPHSQIDEPVNKQYSPSAQIVTAESRVSLHPKRPSSVKRIRTYMPACKYVIESVRDCAFGGKNRGFLIGILHDL